MSSGLGLRARASFKRGASSMLTSVGWAFLRFCSISSFVGFLASSLSLSNSGLLIGTPGAGAALIGFCGALGAVLGTGGCPVTSTMNLFFTIAAKQRDVCLTSLITVQLR